MKKSTRILVIITIIFSIYLLYVGIKKYKGFIPLNTSGTTLVIPYQSCDVNVSYHQLQADMKAYDFKPLEEELHSEASGTDTAICTKTYWFMAKHIVDGKEVKGSWQLMLTYQQVGYDYKLLHLSVYKKVKGHLQKVDVF